MNEVRCIQGRLDATGRRFAIVAARFNQRIVERLVQGATDCFERHGAARQQLVVVQVPGAWEIPIALEELAVAGKVDAMVALGAVIRGETPHFDYVCSGCSSGIGQISAKYRVPIGLGVLTCETSAQAEERAGGKAGNKGWEAALAAIEMADVVARLRADEADRP